eukprot:TRINITY_DN2620_c0_g1_i1.p1 TRINITY_DN2620_c0_g1~~TRINITY_DN2620_c0_g1_i1.p1  ORF type:complete len:597 (-),score=139.58 TRINITY_DN2620_c0_g1_i1:246-2036(-)
MLVFTSALHYQRLFSHSSSSLVVVLLSSSTLGSHSPRPSSLPPSSSLVRASIRRFTMATSQPTQGEKFIVALDQGTTSCRAVVFDSAAKIRGFAQEEFAQIFPSQNWVEHDPNVIWETQWRVFEKAVERVEKELGHDLKGRIGALGITNQRETTVLWDKTTGKPVYNAIVWQDKRTAQICEEIKAKENGELVDYIRETTGLVVDAYFSATKLKWLLDNIDGAREKAKKGELLFGTIDTWLIWKLTNGSVHATDSSNASRTMLFNIREMKWDERLLRVFDIPREVLPEVRDSAGDFGSFNYKDTRIPIAGVAGDQQAALFGQGCFSPGLAKNTYGTGCFMLMNTGSVPCRSKFGLLTTVAWSIGGKTAYALEGSILIAGAAIQWLRDGIKLISSASESEKLANEAVARAETRGSNKSDEEMLYVVPAFVGLGAPYWDMYARGAIFGISRDTGREQIARATLEALAYQTKDVLIAMEKDSGIQLKELRVDGGAVQNNFLLQFQADVLGIAVDRPVVVESTALGAASLAGLSTGLWVIPELSHCIETSGDVEEKKEHNRSVERVFLPAMAADKRERLYRGWKRAVKRSMHWLKEDEDEA